MGISLARRILWMAFAAGSLVSCVTRTQSVNGSQIAIPDLRAITESVATVGHCPANTIEITGSPIRFRISSRDDKLAMSDEGTRNAAAASLVSASERALASHPEFSTL